MSLQNTNSVTAFSTKCKTIWDNWLTGASGSIRIANRENTLRSALTMVTGFMPPLNYRFANLNGDCGSFNWGRWRLSIDKTYTKKADIRYKDFVELCCSAYHEARHAEQFYRIAQGLAAEKLSFPDKSKAQVIQDLQHTGGGGSVRDRIARFEGKGMKSSPQAVRQMISKWLSIPINVAGTAVTAKTGFNGYLNLSKPTWFKRRTVLLEVEEWMRSTYKRTLGGMNEWAQSDHGPYKIYRDLPEEHDAHEIENLIKARITQAIGHNFQANNNKRRSVLG
jgi:hypothetical protein